MNPPDPWTDASDGLAWVSFFSAISVDHKGEILGVGASRYPRRLANWWLFPAEKGDFTMKNRVSSCKKRCKIGISPGFSPIFRRPTLVSMISTKIGDQVISPGVSLWISPSQNRDPNVCHMSMILAKKNDDHLRSAWNLAPRTTAPHKKSKGQPPRFAGSLESLESASAWAKSLQESVNRAA